MAVIVVGCTHVGAMHCRASAMRWLLLCQPTHLVLRNLSLPMVARGLQWRRPHWSIPAAQLSLQAQLHTVRIQHVNGIVNGDQHIEFLLGSKLWIPNGALNIMSSIERNRIGICAVLANITVILLTKSCS